MRARIKKTNHAAVAALFPEAVFCTPHTTWGSGCSDPGCCSQHPTIGKMIGINVPGISGNEFHRRLVAAGITK
jgi:hypothetical protein